MTERQKRRLAQRSSEQLALPLVFSHADRPLHSAIGGPSNVEPSRNTAATSRRGTAEAMAVSYRPSNFHQLEHQYGGAIWRRIIDQGVRFGHVNPQLGSEVGRLSFHGQITPVEAEAASIVADIYARYERSVGLRRSAASPSFVMHSDVPDYTEETEGDVLRARRAKWHYDKLQKAIPSPRARAILEKLCVDDQPIGPIDLMDARIILRRLAEVFGILPRKVVLRAPTEWRFSGPRQKNGINSLAPRSRRRGSN
jgi:hypothetical protein